MQRQYDLEELEKVEDSVLFQRGGGAAMR